MERWFLAEAAKVNARRLKLAETSITEAYEAEDESLAHAPGSDLHTELVQRYLSALWHWGAAHAERELTVERLAFNEAPSPGDRGPLPVEAVAWMEGRRELQGKWDRAFDDLVKRVVAESLSEGLTLQETIKSLRGIFPDFAQARLENIARTESSAAYTQGRLAQFLAPNSGVVAFQLSAMLDGRTSDICRARDGLVLRIEDPRLWSNIPPLHYQCRTVIIPITRAVWRRLEAGDPRVTDRIFGWVPEGGPKNLKEAIGRWDDVPPPLEGFGGETAPTPPPPSAPSSVGAAREMGVRKHKAAVKASVSTDQKLDAVLAAGKDIRKHIESRLLPEMARMGGEVLLARARLHAALIRERAEIAVSGDARPSESAIRETARMDGELSETTERLFRRRQEIILEALSAWRKMGARIDVDGRNSRKTAATIVQEVGKLFPADWTKPAKNLLPHQRRITVLLENRGYYRHGLPVTVTGRDRAARELRKRVRSELAISARREDLGGFPAVATHELQHRFDELVPTLNELATAYLERRTRGDSVERLQDIFPRAGYGPQEVIKRDRFVDPYIGKIYSGATEINTVGLEGLMFGLYNMWERDPEHVEYILGLLATI